MGSVEDCASNRTSTRTTSSEDGKDPLTRTSNPTSFTTRLQEEWQLFKTYMRMLKALILSAPWVLIVPLLLLVGMVVAAEVGLVYAARRYSNERHSVAQYTVSGAAKEVALKLQNMVAPNVAMVAAIRAQPHVPTVARNFEDTARGILTQFEANSFVQQLLLLPYGLIAGVFPNLQADLAQVGRSIFADAISAATARMFVSQGVDFMTILGPLPDGGGAFSLVCATVVAIPNASLNDTLGNDEKFTVPYAPNTTLGNTTRPDLLPACGATCGPMLYKNGTAYRFWGYLTSVVRTTELTTRLADLEHQSVPYKYVLSRLAGGSDGFLSSMTTSYGDALAESLIFATPESRSPNITASDNPECASVRVAGTSIRWLLCIAPLDGWDAPWLVPLQIMIVFVSVIIAGLLFGTLMSQERHSILVGRMLPRKVIRQLHLGRTYAEPFKQVTILFSDIVSYTNISSELTPMQLVDLLNDIYSHFDDLVDKHGLYKVETVGDAFMCVGGAPEPCHPLDAATRVARMALDMVDFARNYVSNDGRSIQIRVGLYTGDVTAAVVGRKMPHACLIGDAVNVASRMESTSLPMHVHVGPTTAKLLERQSEFHLEARGQLDIKGKGLMSTFFVWPSSKTDGLHDSVRLTLSKVDTPRQDDSALLDTQVVQTPPSIATRPGSAGSAILQREEAPASPGGPGLGQLKRKPPKRVVSFI